MSKESGEARGGNQPSSCSARHNEASPLRLLPWARVPLCLAMPYLWMRPRLVTTGGPPLSIVSTTLILLGVCIIFYGALRLSFVRVVSAPLHEAKARQVLVRVVVGWIALTTFLNIRCHDLMTESTEDAAIFEQSFWRTRSGIGFFDNTVEGQSHFGVHASFILLLLYPLYHLCPSYETLLVCSNVCLGIGAIVVFHLARRWMGERESLLVAFIYLAPPVVLSQAAVNNFHEITLAAPCLLGLLYFLEAERIVPAIICAGLALLVKEDVALTVADLCLVPLLRRRLIWESVLLGGAAVLVAPLRPGSGAETNILDAWALGKPVVTTSLGAEGLPAKPGENLAIADTPCRFAEAVIGLLGNPELRHRMGQKGREAVRTYHSWEQVRDSILGAYAEINERRRAQRG